MLNRIEAFYNKDKKELNLQNEVFGSEAIPDLIRFLQQHKDEIESLSIGDGIFNETTPLELHTALAACNKLNTFAVDSNELKNEWLYNIVFALQNKNLISLTIKSDEITSLGRGFLRTIVLLQQCKELKSLTFSSASFGNDDLREIALCLIEYNSQLESLNFSGGGITEEGIHDFCRLMTKPLDHFNHGDYLVDAPPKPCLRSLTLAGTSIDDNALFHLVDIFSKYKSKRFQNIGGENKEISVSLESLTVHGGLITGDAINTVGYHLGNNINFKLVVKGKDGVEESFSTSLVSSCVFVLKNFFTDNESLKTYLDKKTSENAGLPAELSERVLKK